MSTARPPMPSRITHDQLRAACRVLGLDPDVTYRFTIDAEVDQVTVYGYIRGKRGLQRRRHRNHVRTVKAVIPVGSPPGPEPIIDEAAAFFQDAARWTASVLDEAEARITDLARLVAQ